MIKSLKEHCEAVGALLIIILVGIFVAVKINRVEKEGVFTVAKVIKFDGAESGADLHIEIYLDGKKYAAVVDALCYHCIGKFYFVKVLRDDPTEYPIFYEDKMVPDRILKTMKYDEGWKEMPDCTDSLLIGL